MNMLTKSALYIVATPIGNLNDISLRALDVLANVDVVAAEHVHTSGHLLAHHSITTRRITLHQHNETVMAEKIATLLAAGKTVALISDAGTPGVSDPGAKLVDLIRQQGYPVIPIPGANAALCALSASGIVNPQFLFYGFLPTKTGARRNILATLKCYTCTLIFYEAPHRILDCMADLILVFGADRKITIARELTKLFETIHVSTLGDALAWLKTDANQQKGEFVLLLSGAAVQDKSMVSEQAQQILKRLLADLPLKQAVQLAADITGENRKVLYKLALSQQESGVV
ncbi:16S rRNA (cytidine1402-2'-O)-methyltransferase [Nitrosomonas cryotolerans]|uniref:Ribosomal RNA small subunit methyltransferase I n=2 Tax=Nitrosomonas cryotolerans TaxID=44575 RepID=A0A1N6JEQ6_9PROT|nr:16S rRNA (cytidine1402-2'-O)-methyltransferase [Nitrosomonas cryotolerans]SIO42858.1 16S rRNA (cytidine1402-2'-O)-methyltransferase [Nitrosomonas cryotolerans ATCC 49181]